MKLNPNLHRNKYWQHYLGDKEGEHVWTVFTKSKDDKKGEYSDEIDVRTRIKSRAEALRVAEAVIKQDYKKGIKASRVVYRQRGVLFF